MQSMIAALLRLGLAFSCIPCTRACLTRVHHLHTSITKVSSSQ